MDIPELYNGTVTLQDTFEMVGLRDEDMLITASFDPPPGKQFVVLLLGVTDRNNIHCEPETLLNELGYFRKEN